VQVLGAESVQELVEIVAVKVQSKGRAGGVVVLLEGQ
jgi:hypothetical protein